MTDLTPMQLAQVVHERLNRLDKESAECRRLARMIRVTAEIAGNNTSIDTCLANLRESVVQVTNHAHGLRDACFPRPALNSSMPLRFQEQVAASAAQSLPHDAASKETK